MQSIGSPVFLNYTRRKHESPIQAQQTQSIFHRRAQRDVFRRGDARLQSKSFARGNPGFET